MSVTLFDDQIEFIAKLSGAYRIYRRVLGVASTGFGKTVCFSEIGRRAAAKGNTVLIVAHRAEIVRQISTALGRLGLRHGRIQPGHTGTDDIVQVGMVQTVARRIATLTPPSLLIIDEAHHAVAGTWNAVAKAWPDIKILGVRDHLITAERCA